MLACHRAVEALHMQAAVLAASDKLVLALRPALAERADGERVGAAMGEGGGARVGERLDHIRFKNVGAVPVQQVSHQHEVGTPTVEQAGDRVGRAPGQRGHRDHMHDARRVRLPSSHDPALPDGSGMRHGSGGCRSAGTRTSRSVAM